MGDTSDVVSGTGMLYPAPHIGSQEFGGDNTMVVAKRVKAARVMLHVTTAKTAAGMDATRFPRL